MPGALGCAAAVGSAAQPPPEPGAPRDLELQPPFPGGPPAAFAAISSCTAWYASSRAAAASAHLSLVVAAASSFLFGAMVNRRVAANRTDGREVETSLRLHGNWPRKAQNFQSARAMPGPGLTGRWAHIEDVRSTHMPAGEACPT